MCPKSSEVNFQYGFNFLKLNLNSAHHLISVKTDFFFPFWRQLIDSQSKVWTWHSAIPKALQFSGNVIFLLEKNGLVVWVLKISGFGISAYATGLEAVHSFLAMRAAY